jgi:hypothetical protein
MRTLILSCLLFTLGCATGAAGLMRLQDRELLIHPDKPGLAYPHKVEECEYKSSRFKWLGKKCKDVQKMDFYDFNDKAVRDKLQAAGFTCKSKMRFKY